MHILKNRIKPIRIAATRHHTNRHNNSKRIIWQNLHKHHHPKKYEDHLSKHLNVCSIINHTTLATSILSSAKATLVDQKPPRPVWFELSKTSLMEAIKYTRQYLARLH